MDVTRDHTADRAAPPVAARKLTGGSVLLYTPHDERDTEWLHSDTAVSLAEDGGC